jgi:hypothetical protein
MASLANGSKISVNYGAGDSGSRPLHGKAIRIGNSTGNTLFLPDNSAAEKASMYNNFPKTGITGDKGEYLYNDGSTDYVVSLTVSLGGEGYCYSPSAPGAGAPPSCPAGWTDAGAIYGQGNPNTYSGDGTIRFGDVGWNFYQSQAYGCSGGYVFGMGVRRCYAP